MSPSTRQRRASVNDVIDVVKQYALQETVDPLKGMARWIGAGVGGAILLGLGFMLLLLGVLRLLQDELADVFDGYWAWVPYGIVLVLTAAVMAVVASRIKRTGLTEREPRR